MKVKNIVERNLPLNVRYTLIGKNYISLIDGGGTCCANCNKLIANIATVRNEAGKDFNIGLDCLETFLLNNNLLDGKSKEEFLHFKKHLPAYIRNAKKIVDEFIEPNKNLSFEALRFEVGDFKSWGAIFGSKKENSKSHLTFHYIYNGGKSYNSGIKILESTNIKDFLNVVESVTKLKIIVE
ncbi:MAG: hypothetical protein KDD03_13155 [Gelidibacter sp.]|nr:hypothetical protein [Gelidibacter sp.]